MLLRSSAPAALKSRARTALRRERFVPANFDINYNPFAIPEDRDVLLKRDQQIEEDRRIQEATRRQCLMERNCPSLPLATRLLRPQSVLATAKSIAESEEKINPVAPEHRCREVLHEYVDQKREIFLAQLLIDRLNQEIDKIDQVESTETTYLLDQRMKLADIENQYRMNRNQAEADLLRAKKGMETAIRKRCDLSDELKKKRSILENMEYNLFSNEESIESYRRYDIFVQKFTEGRDRAEVFSDPEVLLEEIEALEVENLCLIEICSDLTNERDRDVANINVSIGITDGDRAAVETQTESLEHVELIDLRTQIIAKETETVDRELTRLTRLIESYYLECFKKSSDINALTMLERMELELERMYAYAAKLSPQYLAEKQKSIEKLRREEQRRKKQEALAKEQQRKMKAALERSVQPIHRQEGRPLHRRMLPSAETKQDVGMNEQTEQLQEILLFGPLED
jgi:hypothetical protein